MKNLKITNISLFSTICLGEIAALIYYIPTISAFIKQDGGGMFASVLALLPMFILITVGILFFTIILSITTKVLIRRKTAAELQPNAFDKLCKILPWCFILLNIACFVVIYLF